MINCTEETLLVSQSYFIWRSSAEVWRPLFTAGNWLIADSSGKLHLFVKHIRVTFINNKTSRWETNFCCWFLLWFCWGQYSKNFGKAWKKDTYLDFWLNLRWYLPTFRTWAPLTGGGIYFIILTLFHVLEHYKQTIKNLLRGLGTWTSVNTYPP